MASDVLKEDYTSLNIYQKLARITGDVGAIKKGGTNKEQGYGFIEYSAVAGELRGLFARYGVVIVPRMQQTERQQRVDVVSKYGAKGTAVLIDFTFNVVNADKPDDKFTVSWTGEALDYGDKATNKAATSALKYYLMRQFNISEKGEDADEHSPDRGVAVDRVDPAESQDPGSGDEPADKPASEKQKGMIAALAHKVGKDDAWIDNIMSRPLPSKVASATIDTLKELEHQLDGSEEPRERSWK
jgi:hypothetical protein